MDGMDELSNMVGNMNISKGKTKTKTKGKTKAKTKATIQKKVNQGKKSTKKLTKKSKYTIDEWKKILDEHGISYKPVSKGGKKKSKN